MIDKPLSPETLNEAWQVISTQFPLAVWETVYVSSSVTGSPSMVSGITSLLSNV